MANFYQTNPTGYQALLSELTDFLANIYKKEKINEQLQNWLRHCLPYQPAVEQEMVFTGNESQDFCQQFCQEHGFEEILKSLKKCPDVALFKRLETALQPRLYTSLGGNLNSARAARVKTALLNLAQFPYPEAVEDVVLALTGGAYLDAYDDKKEILNHVPPEILAEAFSLIPKHKSKNSLAVVTHLLAEELTPSHLPPNGDEVILNLTQTVVGWQNELLDLKLGGVCYYLRQNKMTQAKTHLSNFLTFANSKKTVINDLNFSYAPFPIYSQLLKNSYEKEKNTLDETKIGNFWQLARLGQDWSLTESLWQEHLPTLGACAEKHNLFDTFEQKEGQAEYVIKLINLFQKNMKSAANQKIRHQIVDIFVTKQLQKKRHLLLDDASAQQSIQRFLIQELENRNLSQKKRNEYLKQLYQPVYGDRDLIKLMTQKAKKVVQNYLATNRPQSQKIEAELAAQYLITIGRGGGKERLY